jgi:hypothetical protein
VNLAVKIWAEDEPKPEGGKAHNTGAPPNWFKEDPEYAAELYGLERGLGEYKVTVLDDDGSTHKFTVKVHQQLVARVANTT